jgi:hypothetical protein
LLAFGGLATAWSKPENKRSAKMLLDSISSLAISATVSLRHFQRGAKQSSGARPCSWFLILTTTYQLIISETSTQATDRPDVLALWTAATKRKPGNPNERDEKGRLAPSVNNVNERLERPLAHRPPPVFAACKPQLSPKVIDDTEGDERADESKADGHRRLNRE